MTKSKMIQAVEALHEADTLLRKAILLLPKNRRFVDAVVESEWHLDEAIVLADPKQTLLKK